MEWWWLLFSVPLFSLWQALSEAWRLLLKAKSEPERKAIIERAGRLAFLNTVLTIGIAVVPWPYKLLGVLPWIFSGLAKVRRGAFGAGH